MAEPTPSGGCFTSILMVLAAIFASAMAAIHVPTSTQPSTEIITRVTLAPVGNVTTDELNQAAAIIQKRLDGLDLPNSTVEIADTTLIVGLPAVDDLSDVTQTLSARGLLEFVDFSDLIDFAEWQGRDILTTGQGDHPVSDNAEKNPVTDKPFETILTGDSIQSAKSEMNQQFNQWNVIIQFSDEAGKRFGDYTRAHIGKPLAIVLDGKVLSMPVIQAELSTTAVITGNFTEAETKRLALQLGTGSLPFEMEVASVQ